MDVVKSLKLTYKNTVSTTEFNNNFSIINSSLHRVTIDILHGGVSTT